VATQFWKYFINWWICFDIELVLTVSYPIFYQRRKLYCVRIYHAHPVGRNFNDDCFVVKAEGFLMFWFFWWKWEIFLFILNSRNLREYTRCPFYNYSFDCFMDQNNDFRQFFEPLITYIVVNFLYISWYLKLDVKETIISPIIDFSLKTIKKIQFEWKYWTKEITNHKLVIALPEP
jgi:hypothetical protein